MGYFPGHGGGGGHGMSMAHFESRGGQSHVDARTFNYHANAPDYDFNHLMSASGKGGGFNAKEALESGDATGEGLGGLKQQLDGMMKDKKAGNFDNSALKSLVDSLSQMAGMQHSSDAHIVGKGANRMYDLRFLDKPKAKDKSAKDNIKDFKKMLADAEHQDAKILAADPDANK